MVVASALCDGCACLVERVQDCSNLDMGPDAAPSSADIPLIELLARDLRYLDKTITSRT